jgi:autotransporter-associated beta strand protein
LSSRFSTAANQAYSVDTNGQTVTWAGALISSGGSLTKSGGGTLNLTGGLSNAFGGPIAVNGGTLSVTDGTSLKNVTGAITVASGATLNFDQSFTTNNLTNALTLSGTGDGSFGALNLTRNAVVTGGITLAADTRITKGYNNATIQDVAITGSGRNLQLTTTQANQPGLVISSAIQTGAGGVSVSGVANSGAYSVRLGGNNTFTGGLTINNGVVQLNSAGALNSTAGSENAVTFGASTTTGKLALNGRSYTISNLTSNATPGSPVVENGNATAVTLTVGNSQNLSGTYAGVIQDGTGGGALSVTKAGNGTLTLSGTNTYTGATAVNGGTLQLDGSTHANSAVSIGTNGTLAGTGTVNGTLAVSGKLAPGNAGVVDIETLTAGTTTWNAGSIWNFDLSSSGSTSDKLDISGNFIKGSAGTYQFDFMGSTPAWNTSYTLVDWSGTTDFVLGNFSFTNLGAGPYGASSFGFDGSSLTFTAVPEPTSALAGLLLTAGLLRRRRR